VLELVRTHTGVERCVAGPAALDSLPEIPGRYAARVAPDELMLVGSGAPVDLPGVLALDESGAWTVLTLAGDGAEEAFARLSAVPLRQGLLQGTIAGVPGKAIVREGRIHLLVVASLGHYVEERVRTACSDLLADSSGASTGGGA
jgi:hypothetical protein